MHYRVESSKINGYGVTSTCGDYKGRIECGTIWHFKNDKHAHFLMLDDVTTNNLALKQPEVKGCA